MKKLKKFWNNLDMKIKVLVFTVLFLGLDQVSKVIVDAYLTDRVDIIGNFFSLAYAQNSGVAWSMFSGKTYIIIGISIAIFIFLLFYMNKFKENLRNVFAFSMIFGGLFGNLIDRIVHGYVIDFLDFYIINYDFPIFNLADCFIFIGVCLLMWSIYVGDDNENRSEGK